MNDSDLQSAISALPLPQRIELAQELWDSVHADSCAAPFTPEQFAEIARRVAAIDAGEISLEPWKSAYHDLLSEL